MKEEFSSKYILLFSVFIIVATLNFRYNIVNGSRQDWFDGFQYDSESLVVGRLAKSQSEGLFSHAGFLGWVNPVKGQKPLFGEGFDCTIPRGEYLNKYEYQYYLYKEKRIYNGFEGYYSQAAGQAALYTGICKVFSLSGYAAIDLLYWFNSFMMALTLAIILIWVKKKWSFATILVCILGILFSQWITVFARNLYWVLWVYYLPFITNLIFLNKSEKMKLSEKKILWGIFFIIFGTVFVKCLLTGFEYITTTLVMVIVPFIFYAIYGNQNWKLIIRRLSIASVGSLMAVLITIILLAYQLSFVKGSFTEGVNYILYSFGKRTHGNPANFDVLYINSLQSNTFDVFLLYWKGQLFDLSHWFSHTWLQKISRINFGTAIIFFLVLSFIVIFSKQMKHDRLFYKRQFALVVTLWFSILAPLSWFIVFKAHSYEHTHMNHIVWHMPFVILGYILTGSVIWFYLKSIKEYFTQLKTKLFYKQITKNNLIVTHKAQTLSP